MNLGELINHLENEVGVLRTPVLKQAFKIINRADFVAANYQSEAYEDYPIPIGYSQTISQPTTVVFMLELLNPKPGNRILDIGCGSAWTTALLAQLVGKKGKVFGVEVIPGLVELGRKNLAKYNLSQAKILLAGAELGLPSEAPFDRILVSAAAKELPDSLLSQLKIGGVLVIPVQNSIWRIEEFSQDSFDFKKYPGFVFVPLV